MEPTDIEAQAITNMESLANWCELSDDKSSDGLSPRESLFALVGIKPTAHFRAVANIPPADWATLVANWSLNKQAPPPAVASQAALLGRTARVMCKLEKSQFDIAEELRHAREVELEKLKVAATPPASQPPPSEPQLGVHKLKLSQVVDQTNDDETVIMKDSELQRCYQRHTDRMQGPPEPGAECTGEQLTGIKHLLDSSRPPYVDFGIFGPHGYRIRRKLKLAGMILGPGGVLQAVEIVGPPTHADWFKCYLVLRTALIMLDQVGLATLDRYASQINEFANRYGPIVWHIIYQADVRARLEHMERIRRIGIEQHAKATAAGLAHEYDPDKPWDYVWSKMIEDATFWRRELEEPCILVLAKTSSMQSMIGGDAPAAVTGNGSRSQGQGIINYSQPPTHQRNGGGGDTGGSPAKKPRQHNVNSSGHLATNRAGIELCSGFNAGTCTQSAPGAQGFRCAKDPNKAHQCSKCLSSEHGASNPNGCGRPAARAPTDKGGKGKGNGKRGGKGGKRHQY